MSATDHIAEIEERKAQQDLGATGNRIYEGARSDGASRLVAFLVTVAWFRAMLVPPESEDA